ncbi:LPXTG cell wall anchor domain-containing protein [uncultured Streptomyces sp.]|uniref:LPXTG cell wall anchor domain-containing protein n=1 Tax=uncultured Streptomyces sp. TaxID=174707 RepID=UPI00260C6611|nr:LPXTG cell wall anchor domain-containing protein [uncultured Streptomyces sp.]
MAAVHRRARWAALTATAAALLGTLMTGAPAHAEDGPALTFRVTRTEVGLPQPADRSDPPQISWGLEGDADGGTAEDVAVTIDASGISAFTDLDSTCVGDVCSWPARDIAPDGFHGSVLDLNAKPDAPLGTTGIARLFATSSNATIEAVTVKVTVGAVDLGIERIPDTEDVEPGSTLDAPIRVSNSGSLVADGVTLTLAATRGLGFAQTFSNCVYGKTTDIPSLPRQSLDRAVCHIDAPVEPGKAYRLSSSVGIAVKSTALHEMVDYEVEAVSASVPKAAAGPVLGLVEDGTPPARRTAHGQWQIEARNTADIAVTGSSATAGPGEEAVLTATVRNNGPADFNLVRSDDHIGVLVGIPEGTTALAIPPKCGVWTGGGMGEPTPGAPEYLCAVDTPFTVGESLKLPFTVKVGENAPASASGEVRVTTVYGGEVDVDTDKTNNTATITVKTGSSSATPEPTATASGADTQSVGVRAASAGAPSGPAASGSPAATGTMASTGSGSTPAIAAAGALALLAGGAVAVAARRRRVRAGDAA